MSSSTIVARAAAPADPPEGRGRTRIEARVVERIASAVVSESDDVAGGPRHRLSVRSGHSDDVRVHARLYGETRVAIAIAAVLIYPCPVRRVVTELRQMVAERIQQLTGMHVLAVDVLVTGLDDSKPPKAH